MKAKDNSNILNLSQSLEDNSSKIEETHKLIQQIESQLQKLTLLPSVPLTIPTETNQQNPSQQHLQDSFQNQIEQQYDQNIEANYQSNHPNLKQQDKLTREHIQQNMNQHQNRGEFNNNDQQLSQQYENRQNTQFQQASPINSQPTSSYNQKKREIGKIKSQIGPPSREERSIVGNTSANQSLIGRQNQSKEIKEFQRENFQEISSQEQLYKQKLIQIEQQKKQYEMQIAEMQNIHQNAEQKEIQIGQYQNRSQEQSYNYRILPEQVSYNELVVIARRLEICEKEKQELFRENQELIRQYKLVASQNYILSNKYNRILSLYNQLLDNDKERFVQLQYTDSLSKDHSNFTSPIKQAPQYINNMNVSSNLLSNTSQINSPMLIKQPDYQQKEQNELDLLDEIYQQRNANALNQLFYKPFSKNNSIYQKNIYSTSTKNSTFPEEQMNTNYHNNHINIQNMQNNEQMIQNDIQDIKKQTQAIQQQINQLNIKQSQIDFFEDENNHSLHSNDLENQEQNNKQTKKPLKPHLKENNNINNIKSPFKSSPKKDNQGKDLKINVNDIKNTLDENLKINDHNNDTQQNINISKADTLQNILDISGQVANKKAVSKKPVTSSKSLIGNKSTSTIGKSQMQSNKDIKLKPTKKQKK